MKFAKISSKSLAFCFGSLTVLSFEWETRILMEAYQHPPAVEFSNYHADLHKYFQTQKLFASSLEFNSIWWTKTSIWYFLIFSEFLLQQYIFLSWNNMFLSNFLETEAQKRHYKLWNKIIVVGPPHKPRFGAISALIWVMVQIAPILKSANCSTSTFQEITISALSPLN